MVMAYHNNNIATALQDLFPDIGIDSYRFQLRQSMSSIHSLLFFSFFFFSFLFFFYLSIINCVTNRLLDKPTE